MQPQDPYGQNQAYPPQGPTPNNIPQPQIPGQQATPGLGSNGGQPFQPQQPSLPPMPAYQPPAERKQTSKTTDRPDFGPTPAAASTPYDFFMEPKHSAPARPLPMGGKLLGSKPPLPGTGNGGNSSKKLIIFAGAGAFSVILAILAIIAFSPKDQTGLQFFGIAQTQQELIRVCTKGLGEAKIQTTRNFAVTCATGITHDQKTLLEYMGKANLQYDPKLIGGKQSTQTNSKLSQATASSNYDSTFIDLIKTQLTAYNRALTSQLATTTGANGREVLSKNQANVELLIKMIDPEDAATTQ